MNQIIQKCTEKKLTDSEDSGEKLRTPTEDQQAGLSIVNKWTVAKEAQKSREN